VGFAVKREKLWHKKAAWCGKPRRARCVVHLSLTSLNVYAPHPPLLREREREREMKLLTHNMLMSPGTRNGYPLGIEVEKMEEVEAEFNAEFIARMVGKIEYSALIGTLTTLGVTDHSLPAAVPDSFAEDEAFLRALHHALMEIEIIDGELICPETCVAAAPRDHPSLYSSACASPHPSLRSSNALCHHERPFHILLRHSACPSSYPA
jgi:multifunctional methyltransferase subunit TRM112